MKFFKQSILMTLTLFLFNNTCTGKLTFDFNEERISSAKNLRDLFDGSKFEDQINFLYRTTNPTYDYLKLAVTDDESKTGITEEERMEILNSKKDVFYNIIKKLMNKQLRYLPVFIESKNKYVFQALNEIFNFISKDDNEEDFKKIFNKEKLDQFREWHKEIKKIEDPKFPEIKDSRIYVHTPINFEDTGKSMGELFMNKKGENWGSITKGKKWGSLFKGNFSDMTKSFRLEDPRIISKHFPENIYKGLPVGVYTTPASKIVVEKLVNTIKKHGKGTKIDNDIFKEKFSLGEDDGELSIQEGMPFLFEKEIKQEDYYQFELTEGEEDEITFDTIFPEFKRIKEYLNDPEKILNDKPFLKHFQDNEKRFEESTKRVMEEPFHENLPIVAGKDDWHIFPVVPEEGLFENFIEELKNLTGVNKQESETQKLEETKNQDLKIEKITISTKAMEEPGANLFLNSQTNTLELTHESTKKDGQEMMGQFKVLTKTENEYTLTK